MFPVGHGIRVIFTALTVDLLQVPKVFLPKLSPALQKHSPLQDKTESQHIIDIFLAQAHHLIAVAGDIF